jgi:hypothetical protein
MNQNSPQYVQLRYAARERDLTRMHSHEGVFALMRRVLKRY